MTTRQIPVQKRKPGSRLLAWFVLVLMVLVGSYWLVLRPWSLRWGASDSELSLRLPGDELMVVAARQVTRAISIRAKPEKIYPWLIQMGSGRAGLYSYDWFETNILRCPIRNAEQIAQQWQSTKLGDSFRLCPEGSGPPIVYTVARLEPNRAFVVGVHEAASWQHTWAFVLEPQADGSSRLIVRSRTQTAQAWQTLIEFGEFIMERGMMLGIKERAERP